MKLTATDGAGVKEYLIFKLEVSISIAIDVKNSNTVFRVYPNPVLNKLFIDIPDGNGNADISIANIAGQNIKTLRLPPGLAHVIEMENLETGFYFVRINQGKMEYMKKIIKR